MLWRHSKPGRRIACHLVALDSPAWLEHARSRLHMLGLDVVVGLVQAGRDKTMASKGVCGSMVSGYTLTWVTPQVDGDL